METAINVVTFQMGCLFIIQKETQNISRKHCNHTGFPKIWPLFSKYNHTPNSKIFLNFFLEGISSKEYIDDGR